MEQAVAEIKASGTEKSIPRYDNSGALLRELNRVLASSSDSSLDFSTGTTQEGYIIMRPLTLSFQTNTYAQAREIIDQLCASDNLNQISDLNIRTGQGKDKNKVATELVITYFEVAP